MFPTKETVSLFCDIVARDGLANTVMPILNSKNPTYIPALSYLKKAMKKIEDANSIEEKMLLDPDAFSLGFVICFNLFRLQLEADELDNDDLKTNMEILQNYVEFLETENVRLKYNDQTTDTTLQ